MHYVTCARNLAPGLRGLGEEERNVHLFVPAHMVVPGQDSPTFKPLLLLGKVYQFSVSLSMVHKIEGLYFGTMPGIEKLTLLQPGATAAGSTAARTCFGAGGSGNLSTT